MITFKTFLAEVASIADNADLKVVAGFDQKYADKLRMAWEGDVRDHAKGRHDLLFPRLCDPEQMKKLAQKSSIPGNVEAALLRLLNLHKKAMPNGAARPSATSKPAGNDDQWWHAGKQRH
jgi:hypothetical protein